MLKALAIQPRKMSNTPILCGSKAGKLSLASPLVFCEATFRMEKSLGGRLAMERMLAKRTGETRGRTRRRTATTARCSRAVPVCRKLEAEIYEL